MTQFASKFAIADTSLDTILEGDCVDVLDELPARSVDLIFADPPYFLQLQDDLWRPNMTKVDAADDDWDHFADFSDYDLFTKRWLSAARRVLKDTGTIWVMGDYHNIFRVGSIMQDLGFWTLNQITWVKTNPTPNMKGTRFTNATENLIWASKAKAAKYTFPYQDLKAANGDLQMRSDWYLPVCSGKERLKDSDGNKAHSTQKPESLLRRAILASSQRGDIVLDPFSGSGTTCAVAKALGRRFIGIDMDPVYVNLGLARCETVAVEPDDDFTRGTLIGSKPKQRIPFITLIELGKLKAGDTLRLYKSAKHPTDITATVHSDGTLSAQGERGSIHQLGKILLGLPACNGWEHWQYTENGAELPIDMLRMQVMVDMIAEETAA